MRISGKTNSPPGHPNLHKAGLGGGEKDIKRGAKTEPWASLLLKFFGLACPHTELKHWSIHHFTFFCGETEPRKLHTPQTLLFGCVN